MILSFCYYFKLGSAAAGGLAAFSAASAQSGVDDISQRLDDNNADILSLRAELSNLANTQRTFQNQLNTLQNDAVTPEDLALVSQMASNVNNQLQDSIDESRRSERDKARRRDRNNANQRNIEISAFWTGT